MLSKILVDTNGRKRRRCQLQENAWIEGVGWKSARTRSDWSLWNKLEQRLQATSQGDVCISEKGSE